MMGWQWHQLDLMQITYTLLQTDNHASTPPLSLLHARPDTLSNASQQYRSAEGKSDDLKTHYTGRYAVQNLSGSTPVIGAD